MRTFIILGFLMAAANAAGLGYNYAPGLSGTSGLINSGGLLSTGGGLLSSGSGLISTGSGLLSSGSGLINYGGGLLSRGGNLLSADGGLISSGGGLYSSGSGLLSSGSGLLSSGGALISGGSLGGGVVNIGGPRLINIGSLDAIPQTVEVNKQFFHFTAPDEAQDEGAITQELSNVLKKNLQVVFIKAPENNAATNAALQLAKQAIEQKTAIYVLSKQNDGAQLVGQIQQIQENVPTVPEVRFIKYRTQGDLVNARNLIQSQYNNIEGTSQVIDGGVAPVLNYASPGSSLGSATLLGSGIGSGLGSGIIVGPTVGPTVISSLGSGIGSGLLTGSTIGPTIATDIVSGPTLASNIVSGPNIVSGSTIASDIVSGPIFASNSVSEPTLATNILSGPTIAPTIVTGSTIASTLSNDVDGYLPPSPLKK